MLMGVGEENRRCNGRAFRSGGEDAFRGGLTPEEGVRRKKNVPKSFGTLTCRGIDQFIV